MKKIMIDSIDWHYELSLSDDSTQLCIQFCTPVLFPCQKSTDQQIINRFHKNDTLKDWVENRLNAAFQSKYNSKIMDSFETVWRTAVFGLFNQDEDPTPESLSNIDLNGVDDEVARLYAGRYFQYHNSYEKKRKNIDNWLYRRADGSQEIFNSLKKQYKNIMLERFKLVDFKKMLLTQKCAYCGITLEQLNKLRADTKIYSKSGRGFSLEIDRKKPNQEYTEENCCMICYWCNNAKTDEFSPKEFKEIARGINATWKARLSTVSHNEKIDFDGNAKIWDVDHDSQLEK
ncbi:hypothetical protein [Sulfurospirillum sp. UCH001]|uniref:hypothetical protein n=1 Tax=Sulfurospirillum sp. UCH001 TaxID=1581011 RepID=UPI00083536F3|nr:hypothetical protein [Sulfurospirillum sp. UCH001]